MVNFNPRPPRGGRLGGVFVNLSKWIFQSTPPARGATLVLGWLWRDFEYFNPRPPRGGRPPGAPTPIGTFGISIHAPREGGDVFFLGKLPQHCRFQSTPPARGATADTVTANKSILFQSTPPARGATMMFRPLAQLMWISIHAPREGGDGDDPAGRLGDVVFQSTPPARGATAKMHSFTCGSLTNK